MTAAAGSLIRIRRLHFFIRQIVQLGIFTGTVTKMKTAMTDSTPRWHYRFENYCRAFLLLREALEQDRALTQLEKEGGDSAV